MDRPVLPVGAPHAERADAVRNRQHLLATARDMLAGEGADTLTMDALAQRAGLGKGTVFRRFGTRAGIFQALLDDDERSCPGRRRWARARRRWTGWSPTAGPGSASSSSTVRSPGPPWTAVSPSRPGRRRPCPRRTSGSCSARSPSAPPTSTCWPSS
jgi:AcrR family transcriptional regulator